MIELSSFDQPCPDCDDDTFIVGGLPNNGVVVVCECGYAAYGVKTDKGVVLIERTKPTNVFLSRRLT